MEKKRDIRSSLEVAKKPKFRDKLDVAEVLLAFGVE